MTFEDQVRLAKMMIRTQPECTIKDFVAEVTEFDRKQEENIRARVAHFERVKRKLRKQTASLNFE